MSETGDFIGEALIPQGPSQTPGDLGGDLGGSGAVFPFDGQEAKHSGD